MYAVGYAQAKIVCPFNMYVNCPFHWPKSANLASPTIHCLLSTNEPLTCTTHLWIFVADRKSYNENLSQTHLEMVNLIIRLSTCNKST